MLDYTRAIFDKTKKDLEISLTVFQFGTQIIYIAYLIYLLFIPNKIWYLHLSLLLISAAFLVFDIITANGIRAIRGEKISIFGKRRHNEKLSRAKKRRSNIRRIKFYTSHVIKLFVLASTFYPIIVAPDTVHPLSVMCTTVMVLLWIIQIIFEVLRTVLEGRGELFMEALRADVEFVTKPVSAVKNTFKKIIGQEVEDTPSPTKERVYLDGLVERNREAKSAEKASAKAERSEKISSWLDDHISKLSFKRKAKDETDENDLIPVEIPESEITEEKEEV